MLRIGIKRDAESIDLNVEGRLMGPWVRELEKCWQAESLSGRERPIVVNLTSVTFVDSGGRALLTEMRRAGVILVPTGCLMNLIVDEIEAQVENARPN
ncbi:MAG: hypothetical protein DMF61_19005 [Blastocatellia bacterium AA13]|nr:MAG: hypothetical protein DMF61_19005 [Blastocatellia bacterium AA13]